MGFIPLSACRSPRNSSSLVFAFLVLLLLLRCDHQCISSVHAAATASSVHIVYLGGKGHEDPTVISNSHLQMLDAVLGSMEAAGEAMVYSYRHGFSGFAAKLTASQAQKLAEFPEVVHVIPNRVHMPHTTRSWDYLGLDSTSSLSNLATKTKMGDGVIVGVMDTGIWPESPSFKDEGIGPIPSRWKGACETGQLFNANHCNRKLIGARWYIKGMMAELGVAGANLSANNIFSPRGTESHGTHTASTAAGNLVGDVSVEGLAKGTARGGAPKAHLAIYKVMWDVEQDTGGVQLGTSADILKAFDDAIHDGVDVLSLSIGPDSEIYLDTDPRNGLGIGIGAFHAVANGITVVCSAGNDGPDAQTVADANPWIITVAASTLDRSFPTLITLGNNQTIVGQGMFTGKKEIGFAGFVSPSYGSELFDPYASKCSFFDSENLKLTGNVVLCFDKLDDQNVADAEFHAKAAGAIGLIFARNPGQPISPCTYLPCVEVDFNIGKQLHFYIRSSRSPMVKISPTKTKIGKPLSAKVAYFSSRGPNSVDPDLLKPDIAAPGVNIIAAVLSSDLKSGYEFMSGTSMACPHVAGIVALLKSQHPDWSPAAMKSALVTTASSTDESGVPIFAYGLPYKIADPFDYGGGIVNPNKAANPGLIYDMGMEDYVHYLCSKGYPNSDISRVTAKPTVCPSKRPSTLDMNLPSIAIPSLKSPITISRTLTNVGPVKSMYKASIELPSGLHAVVSPSVLVFNSKAKKLSFAVTFSSTHKVLGGYFFGKLTWSDGVHQVRSPIVVRPEIIPFYTDDA